MVDKQKSFHLLSMMLTLFGSQRSLFTFSLRATGCISVFSVKVAEESGTVVLILNNDWFERYRKTGYPYLRFTFLTS
jgi:hypothetical protein